MTELENIYFEYALEVVRRAGNLVREAFNKSTITIQTKSSSIDLVTETDKAVEDLLIKELLAKFPDHKFIGEETAATGKKYNLTDAPTWIIDPIDGTTNFVHKIPFIAICVGLAINKELKAGIVYNPITNELFSAQVGKGAHKNGFPIKVSQTEAINRSVICTSLGIHNIVEKGDKWLDIALNNHRKSIEAGCRGHRAFGSAAINMVYVAQGSIDAYIEYGVHSWDIAAAAVIVREAGGTIINPNGSEFHIFERKVLCAGTKKLATELSNLFTHVDFELEC